MFASFARSAAKAVPRYAYVHFLPSETTMQQPCAPRGTRFDDERLAMEALGQSGLVPGRMSVAEIREG